jgi:hypothetical protein
MSSISRGAVSTAFNGGGIEAGNSEVMFARS